MLTRVAGNQGGRIGTVFRCDFMSCFQVTRSAIFVAVRRVAFRMFETVYGFVVQVVLKEGATPRDMLRAMTQAIYLNHLERTGFTSKRDLVHDSRSGGALRVSHAFMTQQFEQIKQDLGAAGWICEGLIARPAPNRLLESVHATPTLAAS